MTKLSRAFGLVLLGFLAWDLNFYAVHIPLPSFVFWLATLPFALGFYLIGGILLLTGVLEVRRKR